MLQGATPSRRGVAEGRRGKTSRTGVSWVTRSGREGVSLSHDAQSTCGAAACTLTRLRARCRHGPPGTHFSWAGALRTWRSTCAGGVVHRLKHSGSLRPGHRAGVPPVPPLRAGLSAGDYHPSSHRERGRPGSPPGNHSFGGSSCRHQQDDQPPARKPAARPSVTLFRDASPWRLYVTASGRARRRQYCPRYLFSSHSLTCPMYSCHSSRLASR